MSALRCQEYSVEEAAGVATLWAVRSAALRRAAHCGTGADHGRSTRPWLFFWTITLGLIAGVAWHESETLQSHVPTVTRHACANGIIIGRASVIDGDTIEIHGERIRLWGVDAPEGQQYGTSGLMI